MSSTQVAVSPAKNLSDFMSKYKGQIELALPKHITADRMVRLAMTSFSQNPTLQKCDLHSIFGSVVIAAQLGLEIGVGGQGFLVPYKDRNHNYHAQFIPGWQGLVDLVSRSGRATIWTGAVFEGDEFEWAIGDNPFVKHKPQGDIDDWKKITHVYAVGRVKGSDYPVVEVWTLARVQRHLKKYNKVGDSHYALVKDGQNMEMYARKIPLLQALKYMPKSVEVQSAVDVANAVDSGKQFTFDGEMVEIKEDEDLSTGSESSGGDDRGNKKVIETMSDDEFNAGKEEWRQLIKSKKKTVKALTAMIQTTKILTEGQKLTLDSFAHEND